MDSELWCWEFLCQRGFRMFPKLTNAVFVEWVWIHLGQVSSSSLLLHLTFLCLFLSSDSKIPGWQPLPSTCQGKISVVAVESSRCASLLRSKIRRWVIFGTSHRPRELQLPSGKLTQQGKSTSWRCISYWKRWISIAISVYWRVCIYTLICFVPVSSLGNHRMGQKIKMLKDYSDIVKVGGQSMKFGYDHSDAKSRKSMAKGLKVKLNFRISVLDCHEYVEGQRISNLIYT